MATRAIPRTYTFTVRGTSLFPFDMLRYDRCHPKSESDSGEIERSSRLRRSRADDGPLVRDFRVRLVGPRAPTEGRWASFGWEVESVE